MLPHDPSSLQSEVTHCCIQKTRLSKGLSRMVGPAIACSTVQKHALTVVVPPSVLKTAIPTQHPQSTGYLGVTLHTLPVLHQALCSILKVMSYCCCGILWCYAEQSKPVRLAVTAAKDSALCTSTVFAMLQSSHQMYHLL